MESITKLLLDELEREASTTRKMLSIVPNAQYSWKPHEKSMDIKALATHIADIPSWIELILTSDELDFMNSTHQIDDVNNTIELVSFFDRSVEKSIKALSEAEDDILDLIWTMRGGETIYTEATKYESIRMSFGQLIHHRAQLGVFLRLLNIPIPRSYGPSADDHTF